jgi:EAL domain-containing protein (putative c-di-GMP-specific phosphodiesterase class I)
MNGSSDSHAVRRSSGRRRGDVVAEPDAGCIDVLVVDDHRLLADGIVRLLERESDIRVVGVAGTYADGMQAIRRLRPSVVLLDYILPDGDGIDMARQLRDQHPEVRVVLLTGSGRTRALSGAVEAECAAYVDKTEAYRELVGVIRAVHTGATVFPLDRLAELPRLDQLRVHYQPVVDLHTGSAVGVEALVRWQHPTRGLRPPLEFLAAAEENGFIRALGVAVLEIACRQAAAWRAELPGAADLTIAVNVSPRQLDDVTFSDQVARVLAENGLPPAALVIEVTETSVADDPASVAGHLRALEALGIRIAVDDFGTGYASLQQLRECPFHLLKVDRRFVSGLLDSRDDETIVRATVELAHELALTVVAEGIESAEHLSWLRALGCEQGQGFLWSRPVPAEEFGAWWSGYVPTPHEAPQPTVRGVR